MKTQRFKVLLTGWETDSDGNRKDALIETDEDSFTTVGGYLCIGLDGKLKVAEPLEGGMNYRDFDGEYQMIKERG